jgi:hypothetical protein
VGGVDHRQPRRGLLQPLGPPAGAPGQLEHVSFHSEGVERGLDDRHLAVPLDLGFLAALVATPPQPPVVVPRRSCSIEGALLGEELLVIHLLIFAAGRYLRVPW